ncbi:MAG: hypothetical protein ACE5KK_02370 [Candidatus Brocadiales bacterium]
MKLKLLSFFALSLAIVLFLDKSSVSASDTLPDGLLGATKEEVQAKLGTPTHFYIEEHHSRRHWFFPAEDIDKIRPMLWARPDIPVDDVIPATRDGKEFMYRVHYEWDKSHESQPILRATKYWALFGKDKSIALADVPHLVPEFALATQPGVLAYMQRQVPTGNIIGTFLVPEPSELARTIGSSFKPPVNDYEWSSCFQVTLHEGEAEGLSLQSKVSEVVITVESQLRIRKLAKPLRIKDIANPFSS